MQDFSYYHDSLNLRKLSSYNLQIHLSKSGIGYVISDPIRNQHVAVKKITFDNQEEELLLNFQNAIREDVYLNKHYKVVNFSFISKKNTLIPADLFDRKHLKDYFNYNFNKSANEEIHFNYIEKAKAYNVYSLPSVLVNFLVNHFPEIRLFHHTTPFIKLMFSEHSEKNAYDSIKISFQDDLMNIIIVRKGELIFFNDFNYHSAEDAVFYIMSVVKKLFISIPKSDFNIQGTIFRDDKLHKYLVKYIPNIKFIYKTDKEFPFKKVPVHLFANLLNYSE